MNCFTYNLIEIVLSFFRRLLKTMIHTFSFLLWFLLKFKDTDRSCILQQRWAFCNSQHTTEWVWWWWYSFYFFLPAYLCSHSIFSLKWMVALLLKSFKIGFLKFNILMNHFRILVQITIQLVSRGLKIFAFSQVPRWWFGAAGPWNTLSRSQSNDPGLNDVAFLRYSVILIAHLYPQTYCTKLFIIVVFILCLIDC